MVCRRCTEGLFISYKMRQLVRESDIELRKTLISKLETDDKLKEVDPTFETVSLIEDINLELVKDEPLELIPESEQPQIEPQNINLLSDNHSTCSSFDDDESTSDDEDSQQDENKNVEHGSDSIKRPTKKLKRHRNEDPYVHRCCICRTDFQNQETLENHSLDTHISEKSNETSRPFECQICFKRYFTKSSLKRHRREIQKITGTRCCGCKKEFHKRAALMEHSTLVHLPKNDILEDKHPLKYVCDVCHMRFATEMALSHHKTRVYLGKTYHCLKCEKSFMRKATLMAHEKRVHEKSMGTLLCSVCGTGFFDQSTLTNHEKTHVKEKPYECQACMRTFASRTYLQTHMKIHTDPSENIPCPVCEKIFRSSDLLRIHVNNTHNSDNLFQCNICLAKFKSVYYLKFHVRTHTGEKPYECEDCKKTFAHKSGYRRHVRTHTGEKNFMCNFCGKGFSNRPNMLLHEKYHTGKIIVRIFRSISN